MATIPPTPVYPVAIDSDRTLYLVFNTSETKLSIDNAAWSDEIIIEPVGANELEIWGDNGFANISGELFYYDAVEKDENGKIYKFKRCARGIGGKRSQFNKAGTWVRGFVIAEHHNQLVDAVLRIEEFIGIDCEDKNSLTCRINSLLNQPECLDDHDCPDVVFKFEVISPSTNNCEGITTSFDVEINGDFTNFRIDFGDGNFTTSEQSGTHIYAANATIDPIVTVSNDKCQIVQTPIERSNPSEPELPQETAPFEIPIPEVPDFPAIELPDITPPETTLTLPPIVFPCLDFGPLGNINVPSVIVFDPPIDIPSIITIDIDPISFIVPNFEPIEIIGPEIPSVILIEDTIPTIISVEDTIPDTISVVDDIVPVISVIDDIPPEISIIGDIPTEISIIGEIPTTISLIGDLPSTISVVGNIDLPSTISVVGNIDLPSTISVDMGVEIPSIINVIGDISFPSIISVVGDINLPSTISVIDNITPTISVVGTIPDVSIVAEGFPSSIPIDWGTPPTVSCVVTVQCGSCSDSPSVQSLMEGSFNDDFVDSLDMSDFMGSMEVDSTSLGIPSEIKVIAPKIPDVKIVHDLPKEIKISAPKIPDIKIIGPVEPLPSQIRIVNDTKLPSIIKVEASGIPSVIQVESNLPNVIRLELPKELPTTIKIDASDVPSEIKVVGIPESIELKGNVPSEIMIKMPENFEVPLVYKGGPVPIQFDMKNLTGENGDDLPCFAIVPCPKK